MGLSKPLSWPWVIPHLLNDSSVYFTFQIYAYTVLFEPLLFPKNMMNRLKEAIRLLGILIIKLVS